MKKIIMALFVTVTFFSSCTKDDNKSSARRMIEGRWTLESIVTQSTASNGTVSRDSMPYAAGSSFTFLNDYTAIIAIPVDGQYQSGAVTWEDNYRNTGNVIIFFNNADGTTDTYTVNTLTATELSFSNSKVRNSTTVETSFILRK